MYAMVDLSKKKRHVEKASYNEAKAVVETPLYTSIDKSKDHWKILKIIPSYLPVDWIHVLSRAKEQTILRDSQ